LESKLILCFDRVIVEILRENEQWTMHLSCGNSIICPDIIEGIKDGIILGDQSNDEMDL